MITSNMRKQAGLPREDCLHHLPLSGQSPEATGVYRCTMSKQSDPPVHYEQTVRPRLHHLPFSGQSLEVVAVVRIELGEDGFRIFLSVLGEEGERELAWPTFAGADVDDALALLARAARELGPGTCCSPRHRMLQGLADIARHVIGCPYLVPRGSALGKRVSCGGQ